jgi:hypothetical protein
LSFVFESVLSAKTELLGDARDTERLAWEAGAEDVVLRYFGHSDPVDVAVWALAEICLVSGAGVFVPVAEKYTFASCALEGNTEPTYAAEKIDESVRADRGSTIFHRFLFDCLVTAL